MSAQWFDECPDPNCGCDSEKNMTITWTPFYMIWPRKSAVTNEYLTPFRLTYKGESRIKGPGDDAVSTIFVSDMEYVMLALKGKEKERKLFWPDTWTY